ncbi:Endothelin-converting enzyme [Luteimicrobium xylanilyticum]|uniref:Endothelin-converting enzyme n=1 Tax=Luteimicrobium xylanilyticum TaxID=1133546 RepID=A0A5P9Q8U8_9MICO|nr:M13 family metallopeptidase [Luteimicrobium xylanilyticum]QFU97789.1 Endothelin-converting enzyme [Luteimicrobium xylanilyticum]
MTTDTSPAAGAAPSGIELDGLDPATRPQDDLYRHVNGPWIASHRIPADRAMDGTFRRLFDEAEEQVREIIQDAAARADRAGSDEERKVGDLFAAFMDTETVEGLGATPLRTDLDLVAEATTQAELTGALGALQRTGALSAVAFFVDNDAKDPERYVVHLTQSGLGLPDEAYYREEQYAEIRAQYAAHVGRLLALAGWLGPDADADAQADAGARVVALETSLASHHWDVVKDRDADLTYNATTWAELARTAGDFDWDAWARALEVPPGAFDRLVVREPSFLEGFATVWQDAPLEDWKLWAAFHVASARAPYLSDAFVQENFSFYGRVLQGTEQVRDRWKRGVTVVQGALGEAVGKVYVERHFPPAHKARMDALVGNLVEAYRASISGLDWMSEETRTKALAKLDAFTPKIGYPARWRDYSSLVVERDDLVGNVRRAHAFEQDRELHKIGKPIDRDEWFMTPQTVNAYYNPGMNEIVFPAAILRPPFFDPDADDAVNYGGIGAVIGHEIGHGFDDQGSKYDGAGRLESWWTDEDRVEFEKRTSALIAQYDAFVPQQLGPDGPHVNGGLTIGENIGDLGGLSIAITAYRIAVTGQPDGDLDDAAGAPTIDGFTALQRVFLGWAQVWRTKGRDEEVRRRLSMDPHSPDEFRCNGVVRNVGEFYEAFDVVPGDALYLDPADRVRIW